MRSDSIEYLTTDPYLSPCFSLSGDTKSGFKHENEYRFLVFKSLDFLSEIQQIDLQSAVSIGEFISAEYERRFQKQAGGKHILVDYQHFSPFHEVILGKDISTVNKMKIIQLCSEKQIPYRESFPS